MSLICPIILISGIFLISNVPVVQAEPHLRVWKNGVIYYYYSNRSNNKATERLPSPRETGIIRSQARTTLTPQELESVIQEASHKQNVPSSLIKAVIKVESNFHPAATSPKGAQGLMQLMPATAHHLQVANPYDIRENIWGGTRYLGMLLQKFNYRLHLALAAYNAGPQRVERCQDVPAIKETQDFVRDVCTNFLKYSGEKPGGR